MTMFSSARLGLLLAYALVVFTTTTAAAQETTLQWHLPEMNACIACNGNIIGDFDGDGQDEILVSVGSYFTVLKQDGDDYRHIWSSPWSGSETIRSIGAYETTDGRLEVYVLYSLGRIDVYDARNFSLVRSEATDAMSANSMVVADLNGNGAPQLVVIGNGYLRIYDGLTLQQTHSSSAHGGTTVRVGDVTGDGRPEIVVGWRNWDPMGYVLDGESGASLWTYVGGFGQSIVLVDLDGDGVKSILGMTNSSSNHRLVRAFDVVARTPLWEMTLEGAYGGMIAADVTGDGREELIAWNQSSGVAAYSLASRSLLWWLGLDGTLGSGMSPVAVGDVTGDERLNLVFSRGTSWGLHGIEIANIDDRNVIWQSPLRAGEFAVAAGDVTADGHDELIVVSGNSGYLRPGWIHILDRQHRTLATAAVPGGQNAARVAVGDVNDDGRADIFLTDGSSSVWRLDPRNLQVVGEVTARGSVTSIRLGDLNRDGRLQLVVSDQTGYVTVFDAESLEQTWQTIGLGYLLSGTTLVQCEPDGPMDIVIYGEQGVTQAYRGATGTLRWQAPSVTGGTAAIGGDLNRDGRVSVVLGDRNGRITVLDCRDGSAQRMASVFSEPIRSLWMGDLDDDRVRELVVGTSRLNIVDPRFFQVTWSGRPHNGLVGRNGLHIADFTGDRHVDFIYSAGGGVFAFGTDMLFIDLNPPAVERAVPSDGTNYVSLSAPIEIHFSKVMDPETVDAAAFSLDAEGENVTFTIVQSGDGQVVHLHPSPFWPADREIVATVRATVTDTMGYSLDGNRNGLEEGSPLDDFVWSFNTGAAPDTVGPRIVNVGASSTIWQGMAFRIDVTAVDTSTIATSDVIAIVAHLDEIGDNPRMLIPEGRPFSSPIEEGWIVFSTDDWPWGDRSIWIVAQDREGNWGEPHEVVVHVVEEDASNWATFAHDARRSGFNAGEDFRPPFQRSWTHDLGQSNNGVRGAIVVNGTVYIATKTAPAGEIRAIDLHDGSVLWTWTSPPASSIHPPTFAYGIIYVQTGNHTPGSFVHALDASTGELIWQSPYSTQWASYGPPAVQSRKLFVGAGYYGGMAAYDAFDGTQLWAVGLAQVHGWSPAAFEGAAYTPVLSGHVRGLNAASGLETMRIQFYGGGWGEIQAPTIDDETRMLYITASGLNAVDLDLRKTAWTRPGEFGLITAVDDKYLYALRGGRLVAFDKWTGAEIWASAETGLVAPPVITSDYVITGSTSVTSIFNKMTGKRTALLNAGGAISAGNGHILVASKTSLNAYRYDSSVSLEPPIVPLEFALYAPFPNPTSSEAVIRFSVPGATQASVKIYNLLGQEVARLTDGHVSAGSHELTWSTSSFPSGVYLVRLVADGRESTTSVVVAR
jgi:hypothetical protein